MRRFRFSLEPALRLRQRMEEQAQLELAERQRRLAAARAEAEKLRQALRDHEEERAGLQRRTIEIGALTDAERYGEALLRSLEAQTRRVTEADAAVEAGRSLLQQRRMEREALERLRDRRLTEHRAEELRTEQQSLDEASVLRWRR